MLAWYFMYWSISSLDGMMLSLDPWPTARRSWFVVSMNRWNWEKNPRTTTTPTTKYNKSPSANPWSRTLGRKIFRWKPPAKRRRMETIGDPEIWEFRMTWVIKCPHWTPSNHEWYMGKIMATIFGDVLYIPKMGHLMTQKLRPSMWPSYCCVLRRDWLGEWSTG